MTPTGWPPPYRVPPPPADRLIDWPQAFGRRFTVFVDVEEEFDWSRPLARAAHDTRTVAALPDAHRRFAERGVGWTCMVDYPVATDPRAVAILTALGEDRRTAIGAQLHGWVNPPFEPGEERVHGYAGRLPVAAEAAKIDRLTDAIAAAFGARPRVFRSGRYGIGPETLRLLADRGYVADSSVRARYSYAAEGGPDFSAIDARCWREGGVVELPLTSVHVGALRRFGGALGAVASRSRLVRSALSRTGMLSRVALTPEGMPLRAALRAIDAAAADDLRLLCLSFHSPSLVPGHTPYVRDAADRRRFDGWWDAVLTRLDDRGYAPASFDQIMAAAGRGG